MYEYQTQNQNTHQKQINQLKQDRDTMQDRIQTLLDQIKRLSTSVNPD